MAIQINAHAAGWVDDFVQLFMKETVAAKVILMIPNLYGNEISYGGNEYTNLVLKSNVRCSVLWKTETE